MAQALIDQEFDKLTPYLNIIQVGKLRALTISITQFVDYGISSLKPKNLRVLNHFFVSNSPIPEEVVAAIDLSIRVFLKDKTATANYLLTSLLTKRKKKLPLQIPRSILLSAINLTIYLLSRFLLWNYTQNWSRCKKIITLENTPQIIANTAQFCELRSKFYYNKEKIILQGLANLLGKGFYGTQQIVSPTQEPHIQQENISLHNLGDSLTNQIRSESLISGFPINNYFQLENHQLIQQLKNKANKLQTKYNNIKQKLAEQNEIYYTEREMNNIQKILELTLPINFEDLFNLDDYIDWDDFIRVTALECLKIPWIYLQSQGYKVNSHHQLLLQLDVRTDLTDYKIEDRFQPYNKDPNIDEAQRFIPEIAMASGNTIMARQFLTQAQHLSRAESDFYKRIKLYLTTIMACIDSLHDTSDPDKVDPKFFNHEVYNLIKQCAEKISGIVNHLGHPDPNSHTITYFMEDKKERQKQFFDLTSQTFNTELLKS